MATRNSKRYPALRVTRRAVAMSAVVIATLVASSAIVVSGALAAESGPAIRELRSQVRDLKTENKDTEAFVDRLLLPLTILVGLLAGGGVIGLITSIRYERRQSQLHDLAVRGETASQARAEQSHVAFLAGSQETLNLVNDTLALARQASERAAEAQQQKTRERMDEFDRTAKAILDEVYSKHDFKEVVKNASFRDDLVDVAHKLENIAYLGLVDADPPAACMFAQGLAHHLESAPKKAQISFRAAESTDDKELSALALYWAGYEANNVGEYTRAVDFFRQARVKYLDDPERVQQHELIRMEIKTRFFEIANTSEVRTARRSLVTDLIQQLEAQITALEKDPRGEFKTESHLCHETLAEIYTWCARVSPLERATDDPYSADDQDCLQKAEVHFKGGLPHLWSKFGLMQVRWLRAETSVAQDDYDDLHETLEDERHAHRERRSVSLRQAAMLIAEKEGSAVSAEHLKRTYRDVRISLDHVDHAITIFSPWRKCNVTYDDFVRELKAYYRADAGEGE